jgi:hypothetical protein
MIEKTNRGGEGRNARSRSDRSGPAPPRQPGERAHGIARTPRGEDQPADKARAQKVHKSAPESEGAKAQREVAEQQSPWSGEPPGHE